MERAAAMTKTQDILRWVAGHVLDREPEPHEIPTPADMLPAIVLEAFEGGPMGGSSRSVRLADDTPEAEAAREHYTESIIVGPHRRWRALPEAERRPHPLAETVRVWLERPRPV